MKETRIVGVSYGTADAAPVVMLKATGEDAERLLSQARTQAEVPVVRDPKLVNELYRVPLDQPIGRELFPVMAVLLAHVLELDRKTVEQKR